MFHQSFVGAKVRSDILKTVGPIVQCTATMEHRDSHFFTFRALHVNQIDHPKLMKIIEQIPEIELMLDPA